MALTAEEAYLEELWREEDEQSEEATAMQVWRVTYVSRQRPLSNVHNDNRIG